MRIGYLDCFSGVSGDMFLGALLDAGVPLDFLQQTLAGLPLSGYRITADRVTRAGVAATHAVVQVEDADHPPRGLDDVLALMDKGSLAEGVKSKAAAVFRRLAEAEAKVHGTEPAQVHFHEVGAVDAICDVVGTVAGLAELNLDALMVSPIALGGGTVKTAHGSLPVPAPAAAELLQGFRSYGGPVEAELTTPTGAALVSTLTRPADAWPDMSIERIACGAGTRDIDGFPNVLRLAIGRADPEAPATDHVWLLQTNLDDMTGEQVGFAAERLLDGGALDVWTTPLYMKKGRPGLKLSVLCSPEHLSRLESLVWQHTSTLGLRRTLCQRSKLSRTTHTVQTPWGGVSVKVAQLEGDEVRCAPEYEDCRRIAEEQDIPLQGVMDAARKAYEEDSRPGD